MWNSTLSFWQTQSSNVFMTNTEQQCVYDKYRAAMYLWQIQSSTMVMTIAEHLWSPQLHYYYIKFWCKGQKSRKLLLGQNPYTICAGCRALKRQLPMTCHQLSQRQLPMTCHRDSYQWHVTETATNDMSLTVTETGTNDLSLIVTEIATNDNSPSQRQLPMTCQSDPVHTYNRQLPEVWLATHAHSPSCPYLSLITFLRWW